MAGRMRAFAWEGMLRFAGELCEAEGRLGTFDATIMLCRESVEEEMDKARALACGPDGPG